MRKSIFNITNFNKKDEEDNDLNTYNNINNESKNINLIKDNDINNNSIYKKNKEKKILSS